MRTVIIPANITLSPPCGAGGAGWGFGGAGLGRGFGFGFGFGLGCGLGSGGGGSVMDSGSGVSTTGSGSGSDSGSTTGSGSGWTTGSGSGSGSGGVSTGGWYLILAKGLTHLRIRRRSRKFLSEFWAASSLEQVENEISTHGAEEPFAHLASHAIHAQKHHTKYGALKLEESGSTAAFVTRTIRKVIDEETARLENGLTVLASVGSTAPFVGLFGTVWGVYHALLSISMTDGVTINRIAGPVGEALIMTGLGLAVAIPAVLAYNAFVRVNRVYLAQLDAFAHDLFTFLTTGQPVGDGSHERHHGRTISLASHRGA